MDKKRIRIIILAVLAAAALYGVYFGWIRHDMSDFGVCYQNGRRILDGETLYRASDGHLQFKYAPVSALFYAPLALLPLEAAKIVWYTLELILLAAVFWISYRLLPWPAYRPVRILLPAALVLLKFLGRELELGQVNLLIIFLLVAMIRQFYRKQDIGAGALWALSLFFKPYALIFLPYAVLKKRFKFLGAGAVIVAAGLLLPALIFGFKGNAAVLREWISTLSISTPGLMAVGDTASLFAFLWKILPGHPDIWIKAVWLAVGLAAGFLLLAMMARGKKIQLKAPEVLESAYLMVLIPLLSPLGWYYNFLYSVLAVVLLIAVLPKFAPVWKWIAIADLIMIGASLREILGKDLFRFYTGHSLVAVNFLIVLVALAYARFDKRIGA